jgi:Mrp family chromosome partitioning ATPase
VSDAVAWAEHVDGILLVGEARQSSQRDVRRATAKLHQVDAVVLGSVLNDLPSRDARSFGYGYSTYASTSEPPT